MIVVEGLKHSYGSQQIDYPDFEIPADSCFSIIGNSGSGKTTLLHLMAGLIRCQQGKINIDGTSISSLGERELDRFRGSNLGIIFQKSHLLRSLTVSENLLVSQFFSGNTQKIARVNEVLKELNLEEKSSSKPTELSQGEAQRVAIGRAVMNEPKVIMADEPTSSLDDDNCENVLNLLIAEAKHYKASLVIVTHDQRVKEVVKDGINLNTP